MLKTALSASTDWDASCMLSCAKIPAWICAGEWTEKSFLPIHQNGALGTVFFGTLVTSSNIARNTAAAMCTQPSGDLDFGPQFVTVSPCLSYLDQGEAIAAMAPWLMSKDCETRMWRAFLDPTDEK
eukprot:scaffold5478_cov161-Amphora_coffeaeformis.AAC.3